MLIRCLSFPKPSTSTSILLRHQKCSFPFKFKPTRRRRGFIITTQSQKVLVVQEKNGRFRGSGIWKFPTGVVDEKQESEIVAAEWIPFEKYAAQPFVQKHDLLKYIIDICKVDLFCQAE